MKKIILLIAVALVGSSVKKIVLLLLVLFFGTIVNAQKKPKVKVNDVAPNFTVTDVYGNTLQLSALKGKKVLLTFYRNVGCPVCNLRFHQISEQDSLFKANNTVLIAVYESSPTNMLKYVEGQTVYPSMIPDSAQQLYALYNVERSTGKFLKSMFHGANKKMKKGKKLFTNKVEEDGNINRIGAEFFIDEKGVVQIAHYGRYVGDDLPIEEIKNAIEKQ